MTDARSIVRVFLMGWFVVAGVALWAVLTTEQLVLHARVNSAHAAWADSFFRWFTHAGDGLVPTAVSLLLLFIKDIRSFLMLGLSCGLSAIAVQALKRSVFAEHHRPGYYRDALVDMDWVQGLDQLQHFSFPSGHATCAFSMCLALAVVIGKKRWALPLQLLAVLLAWSRVYLSQHFTEDVLAGSALGTLSAVAVHRWLYDSAFATKPWLSRRLWRQNQ